MADGKNMEKEVFTVFSELAETIGYSPIHGKIIAALIVEDHPLPLQEIAKRTRYSTGMISLSLDLLEVLGVIKKIKKTGDRKLYVSLEGDLLEILKKAVIVKVKKGIVNSLEDIAEKKKKAVSLNDENGRRSAELLSTLESEVRRLEKYINLLSGIRLP
ncbi:MAG: hypothetical protein JW789_03420 [Candidatus Aenigmarchaeota archaeon]|nr:hypothetical protein [Candidatus Aenigmarchaeota archaeon]